MGRLQYGMESLPAAADIDQDLLVKEDTGEYALCTAATDEPAGVTPHSVAEGDDVSPQRGLVEYVICSEAISAGDYLMPAAGGKVAIWDSGTSLAVNIGRAVDSGGLDEKIRIEFATFYDVAPV